MPTKPIIDAFFDEATYTVTYLVSDPETGRAAIVDPVLDYDHKSGKASTASAERVLAKAAERQASVDWILETHAHADHLTAAPLLKVANRRPRRHRRAHPRRAEDLQARCSTPRT